MYKGAEGLQEEGNHREAYWLEAVLQGGMEVATQRYAAKVDGCILCTRCGPRWEEMSALILLGAAGGE